MNAALQHAIDAACKMQHEYIMPEHVLLGMLQLTGMSQIMGLCGIDYDRLKKDTIMWLLSQEKSDATARMPQPSWQMKELLKNAMKVAAENDMESVDVGCYAYAMLELKDSEAAYLLGSAMDGKEAELLKFLNEPEDNGGQEDNEGNGFEQMATDDWKSLVSDISEEAKTHTPLIGRKKELDRTIQVLCRMEKNNVLHIGDPGVGKTAIIYGLATMINEGRVPKRLKGYRIYGMDIGQLIAGTQFRGDFEKRLKIVMDGASKEKAILYLDEIHNIIGAGNTTENGPDASNIMKPYLSSGKLRFIGATTHEEYNRKMSKDGAITRRFQTIDINEPSVEEAIEILHGLRDSLQKFHNVVYRKDALEYAVKASAKHISGRCLPDKAIDLVDEAGAYLEVHPTQQRKPYVTKALVDEVLMKVCKIQANALKESDNDKLLNLRQNMLCKIYGQDKAIEKLAEAVMMAKAGLADDGKPLAQMLFVGPTGVGKTEVARVLAKELGVELVRFDMSEFTEEHSVAKLIGSPAGYVGYNDGGQLTDAIRKTPNCVLLLDEIEKAHSTIYNILLQVMDYGMLTDNKGQKADFRNVILIMTSNAGAQYAAQASVGFNGGVSKGQAMMKQVKKTFKPEFLNRLSDIVVFNDMDEKMAGLILNKKLRELNDKMAEKKISFSLTDDALALLRKKSFTKEYGGREADRVLARELKPLLTREILFGKWKSGDVITVETDGEKLRIAK